MSDTFQSYAFGKLLHIVTGAAVSIFQAGLVTLAVLSFSLLAVFASSFVVAWLLPDIGGASYAHETEAEMIAAVPDWMGRLEAWIVFLGMPLSVFVSLLASNSRVVMWFCVGAMTVTLAAIELFALGNSGHGIIFIVSGAELSVLLLLLMFIQWLAFRGFLWAAGVNTLWR